MPRLESTSSPAVSCVTHRKRARTRSAHRSPAYSDARADPRRATTIHPPSNQLAWDEQELDKYLANPPADVHGTKMVISVPNAEDRQNVIAYLKTLK